MIHKFYLFIISCLVGLLCFTTCKYNNYSKDIIVLSDSINTVNLKNGELLNFRESAELSMGDLKKVNKDLYDEIKHLKDNPLVVEKIKIKIKYDTIHAESTVDSIVTDNSKKYNVAWKYNDLSGALNINGVTSLSFDSSNALTNYYTNINDLDIGVELIGSITKTKKGLQYNIISKNPNVHIKSMEGYMISDYKPKPKKFGISLFGGPTYDFTNKNVGVSIGFGVSYDILQLF